MADLIDRQKIKAKFEPWLKVNGYSEGELNMLKAVLYEITIMPSAQPDVPDTNVGDMISRQAAIDALDVLCQEHRYKIPGKIETYSQYNEAWQDALDRAEGAIGILPSVDMDLSGFSDKLWHIAYERGKAEVVRHGKWLDGYGFAGNYFDCFVCDQCKKESMAKTNYCPHCGALMNEVT